MLCRIRNKTIVERASRFDSDVVKILLGLPFACLFICSPAGAQTLSIGVVGGASVTQDFHNYYQPVPGFPDILSGSVSKPERYIVGGMLEFRLPRNWLVELDALYHPLRFAGEVIYPDGTRTSGSPSPVVTFEFPVLAKYRFQGGSWRPFLEGGASFRTAGNLNGRNPSRYGAVVGAGVETRVGRLRIAPEVRYVRWANDNSFHPTSTRSDQLELLTSVSTAGFEGGHAFGGRVSLGVILGTTLSPDFRTVSFTPGESFTSNPGTFLAGATVEIAVARRFFLRRRRVSPVLAANIQFRWDFLRRFDLEHVELSVDRQI